MKRVANTHCLRRNFGKTLAEGFLIPSFTAPMKRTLVNSDRNFGGFETADRDRVTCYNSVACYRQGEVLANAGQYAESLANFDRAITLQPHYDAAWVFRGVVLIHLEQYQDALLSCDRAIKISPNNAEAWMFRGVALQRLGRYQEAYASYGQAMGEEPASLWQSVQENPLWQRLSQGLSHLCKGLISRNC